MKPVIVIGNRDRYRYARQGSFREINVAQIDERTSTKLGDSLVSLLRYVRYVEIFKRLRSFNDPFPLTSKSFLPLTYNGYYFSRLGRKGL